MQQDPNNPVRLIDALIDDVAREITGARHVDDTEGFVRQVSARIQQSEVEKSAEAARMRRIWRRTWVLAPAAAAVLVLAVMIVRQVQSPNATTETASGLRTETASGLRAETASGLRAETASGLRAETASGLRAETASGLRAQGSGLGEVQPSALGPQPSALSPQPSALSPQPSALSAQPLARRVREATAGRGAALPPSALSGDPDFQPLTTAPIETAALDVSPLVVAMPIEISTIAIERIEIAAMP
jgi:hypothetical protein